MGVSLPREQGQHPSPEVGRTGERRSQVERVTNRQCGSVSRHGLLPGPSGNRSALLQIEGIPG